MFLTFGTHIYYEDINPNINVQENCVVFESRGVPKSGRKMVIPSHSHVFVIYIRVVDHYCLYGMWLKHLGKILNVGYSI